MGVHGASDLLYPSQHIWTPTPEVLSPVTSDVWELKQKPTSAPFYGLKSGGVDLRDDSSRARY